ncbi:hypothetical protein SLS53_006044 [Cytospora paraplurivora]|uniref:Major facilitator superfamily (MFS) profile domain-containing protein n=1 Tax=Cytospora paraplurivora TaxID=2898453 RepID=A0AAN9YFJ8_9PEZI
MRMSTPANHPDAIETHVTKRNYPDHRVGEGEKEEVEQERHKGGSIMDKEGNRKLSRGFRWSLICISLYVTCFLYGLDTTIAADVQGSVTDTFGHVEQLSWIGAGFPLGSVCVILLLGALYNTFNIKWVFIITVLLFMAGSALCGGAPTMSALIVGRVIAGAGGSGIYLGSLQYFAVMTTDKERGLYMSFIGVFWGLGAVLGPLIGGAFSISTATWRWAFYINLVIDGTTALALLFYLLPINPLLGVSLLPFIVVAVTVNLVSGSLLHFIKVYKAIFIIAGVFLVAGGGPLVVYLDSSSSTGTIYGLTMLVAVGSGLSMVTGYTVATLTTAPEDAGAGLSLQNMAQIGGQVIALAIAGQIYQSTAFRNLSAVLAGNGFSDQEIRGAVAGVQSTLFGKLDGELRDRAIVAVTGAMKMTFVLVPVAGGVMLIAALCMKREKLFKDVAVAT